VTTKTGADDAAQRLFAELTDRAPEGIWSAPGRVNLIGEHTDYNDGFVLPFAIDRRTYVAAGRSGSDRGDARIRVASTFARHDAPHDAPQDPGHQDPGHRRAPRHAAVECTIAELTRLFPASTDAGADLPEWAAYPLGVAWALIHVSGVDPRTLPGVDLAVASDVPVGAGLSSSAAIEGATAFALNDLWGLGLDRITLAQVGRRAENEAVGAPTGIMDQMASLFGEPDAAIFLDCRSLATDVVELGLTASGLQLLVIDTGVKHAHSTGGYGERRAACERGAAAMDVPSLRDLGVADLSRARAVMDDVTFRRVRHVVTENQRVLDTVGALREHGPTAIGPLLDASHASMRDDFEISVPELDTAVDTAIGAGAIGARMTGGGFGGAAIALVPADVVDAVTDAELAAFASAGYATPHVFTVVPSMGARRDT
jgi:galactokinase